MDKINRIIEKILYILYKNNKIYTLKYILADFGLAATVDV